MGSRARVTVRVLLMPQCSHLLVMRARPVEVRVGYVTVSRELLLVRYLQLLQRLYPLKLVFQLKVRTVSQVVQQ